jgi:hypothetical protein
MNPVNITYDIQGTVHSYIFLKKIQRYAVISQINFWNRSLHVSDSSSVHHQESSNVHTAIGLCHTDYADCLLAGSGFSYLDASLEMINNLHLAVTVSM